MSDINAAINAHCCIQEQFFKFSTLLKPPTKDPFVAALMLVRAAPLWSCWYLTQDSHWSSHLHSCHVDRRVLDLLVLCLHANRSLDVLPVTAHKANLPPPAPQKALWRHPKARNPVEQLWPACPVEAKKRCRRPPLLFQEDFAQKQF